MAIGKIIISKRKEGGRPWQNEYPFRIDLTNGPPTDAELRELGAGELYNEANTDPVNFVDPTEHSLIAKLLAFERYIHYAGGIVITNIYVTDGIKQAKASAGAPNTSVFWSANLSLDALRPGASLENNIAPGTIALLAKRSPSSFSSRQGKCFYRGVLLDTDVRFNGDDKVDWTNTTVAADQNTYFLAGLNNLGLDLYFGEAGYTGTAPYEGPISLGIGRARGGESTAVGSDKNDLVDVMPMTSYTAYDVVSRQARRGKRKKTT